MTHTQFTNAELSAIELPLTQDQTALISPEDACLAEFKWTAMFKRTYGNGGAYMAFRKPGPRRDTRTILLHRAIMERMLGRALNSNEHIDHVNGNPLDNRRINLRLATPSQNAANRRKQSNNTSGYKGVSRIPGSDRWQAHIQHQRKQYNLGSYATPEDAYKAYLAASRDLHGEFARHE